ncbi:flavin monoamine oxidase family protein [Streptomyces boluensis]|uniref:FAD-dependent oxidoreductase n=1 Tax=Streptomyces boluensis TaxID=1775135 RepID=A0A964ULH9_9ACTN|nr:NAD(P)/FAD-dependent oxidoreductase [Streptomyces boluensis]NBE49918.1 FAD-dependent oxidoreductase [Streptomyces boluensis]
MTSHPSSTSSTRRHAAPRFGRRFILKASGASALAGAIGVGAYVSQAAPSGKAASDVIVIGAGYAGGTAARELRAKGLSVTVLEARDRIGGRIWTDTFAGEQIDLGGGWVSPDQPLVTKEMQRYGLQSVPELANTSSVMPADNGFVALTPTEANTRMNELLKKFFAGSEQYFERPNDPLFRKDLLEKVDPLSFADRIAQLELTALDKKWLAGYTSAYVGGDNTRGAMTALAQWWALGGWTTEAWHNQMGYRPTTGMTALLKAMLDESGATVKLSSPVASVTETGSGVEVKTKSGEVHTAKAVVVAVPVNMWKTIQFNPGLPKVHTDAASEGVGVGLGTKVWIHLSGTVDAVYGQGTETSPLVMLIPQKELPGGGRLMVGFAGPSLDASSKTAVQNAVREYIPGATVVAHRSQEWGNDPYSRGGWGLRRPGQLLRQLPGIQQPHGRMLFAGADVASGWNGAFIEGAIESGFRAAEQAGKVVAAAAA